MATFAADISNWIRKTGIAGELVVKKLAFDGYRGLLLRSPVDTGRFRGNWRIALGRKDPTTSDEKSGAAKGQPPTGDETSRAASALVRLRWGTSVHISNSLPYSERLENGWSRQAPNGVLSQTFHELRANLERNIREASREARSDRR